MTEDLVIDKRYRIIRQIGSGGMGIVYQVVHVVFGDMRALKQLKQQYADDPKLRHQFQGEAVKMQRLIHDHIVRVHDFGIEPGFGAFYVMDYIEGCDLSKMRESQGPLPYAVVLRIGSDTADALHYAHAKDLIHRDIKPANILIESATGSAKVTDFGIAKRLHRDGEETTDLSTIDGFKGTVRYSSPEQLRSEDADPRWDIYSLGCVLFEIFSGKRFLESMKEGEIAAHVGYMPGWKHPLEYPEEPPPAFKAIIEECIDLDLNKRVPTAAEVKQRLLACLRDDSNGSRLFARAIPETDQTVTPDSGAPPRVPYISVPAPDPTAPTEVTQPPEALQVLRAEVAAQLEAMERLENRLQAMGVPRGDRAGADDFRASATRITSLEESSQYEQALEGLEGLREQLRDVQREMEDLLRQSVANGAAEATGRWQSLADRGGAFVSPALRERFAAMLASTQHCLETAEYTRGWQELVDARQLFEEAEEQARAQAEGTLGTLFQEIKARVLALEHAGGAADLDVPTLQERVATEVQEGRYVEAVAQAETAAASLQLTLQQLQQAQADRTAALRGELETVMVRVDLEAAETVAADEVARGRQAQSQAIEAEQQRDYPRALTAYTAAREAFEAVATRLEEREEEQLRGLVEEVRRLFEETESAPPSIVQDARRRATAALEQAAGPNRHAARAPLEQAGAALQQALADAALCAAAGERRQAAEAAQQRVVELNVGRREQRAALRLMNAAAAAFGRDQWTEARDRYVEALEAWETLEQTAAARSKEAQQQALQRRIEALTGALQAQLRIVAGLENELETAELPYGDWPRVAELHRSFSESTELQRNGQLEHALAQLEALQEQTAHTRQAIEKDLRAAIERGIAELRTAWQDLTQRAERFVPRAQGEQFDGLVAAADRDLTAAQWAPARQAVAAAQTLLAETQETAHRQSIQTLTSLLQEIDSTRDELHNCGALPPDFDVAILRQQVDASMEARQFAESVSRAEAALEHLRAILQEARKSQCDAARTELEALRGAIDPGAAQDVAPDELDSARRAQTAAAEAEQREDYVAAAGHYQTAYAAYQAVAAKLDEQLAARRTTLQGLLAQAESAPPDLVGDLVGEATALLDGTLIPSGEALAALAQVASDLGAALGQADIYNEAVVKRLAAEEVQGRVAAVAISAQEQESAERDTRRAASAFAQRRWTEARDLYAAAQESWLAIERDVQARQAARDRLAPLVEQAGRADERVVGPALARAQALLATADSPLASLEESESQLTAALAELPLFEEAAAQQTAAKTQAKKVGALPRVKPRKLNAAARLVSEADAAFDRRQWMVARDRYMAAIGVFAAIAAALEGVPEIGPQPVRTWYQRPVPLLSLALALAAVVLVMRPMLDRLNRQSLPQTETPHSPAKPPKEDSKPIDKPPLPIEQPQKPVVVQPMITSPIPNADQVALKEGATQQFTVKAEGGLVADLKWFLGKDEVASGTDHYEYEPGFDGAGQRTVTVQLANAQPKSWTVEVEKDQLPNVIKASPPQGEVQKESGQRLTFEVEAKDPDGDPLQYAWTVDGKAAGTNAPKLDWQVAGNQKVNVAIRGGTNPQAVPASWQIVSIPPFRLDSRPDPAKLTNLRFQQPQKFELLPPAALAQSHIDYTWMLDGHKVSDTPTFAFQNDDAGLVREKPVQVTATAHDDRGRPYEQKWNFKVLPPVPKIVGVSPPTDKPVEVEPGTQQTFEISAAPAVGGQALTYVFDTNGKQVRPTNPRYQLIPTDGQQISAHVTDNFGQRSVDQQPWKVASINKVATVNIESQVKGWLQGYREAFISKNVPKLTELLQLSPAKAKDLETALKIQCDLQVVFSDSKIETLASDRARATYQRSDQFTNCVTGEPKSLSTSVQQTFHLVDGRVEIER